MLTRHTGLQIEGTHWQVVRVDEGGHVASLGSGEAGPRELWKVSVVHRKGGQTVYLDGKPVWGEGSGRPMLPPATTRPGETMPSAHSTEPGASSQPATSSGGDLPMLSDDAGRPAPATGDTGMGDAATRPASSGEGFDDDIDAGEASSVVAEGSGMIGLLVDRNSYLFVPSFKVRGLPRGQRVPYLYTAALLDSAEEPGRWYEVRSGAFRFNLGAVSKEEGAAVQWCVKAKRAILYAPKGPDYGTVEVLVDGHPAGTTDLNAPKVEASAPIWSADTLPGGPWHSIGLRATKGLLPVDCLEAGD